MFASSNQAGTAILLILSAIFLLIGIQGTSLIRFSAGSNSVELERRKRVEKALKEATEDADIGRAEGIVEGISIAQPTLASLPEAEARLYQRRLEQAIIEMGYRALEVGQFFPDSDLRVLDDQGKEIGVVVKYVASGKRLNPDSTLRQISGAMMRGSVLPMLLAANAPFSANSRQYAVDFGNGKVRLVMWRDERDNDVLRDALVDLFDSIPTRS